MTKDYFVKLTVALYKVTELFPEKEPLKYQIREIANQILALLIGENPTKNPEKCKEVSKNIEILCGYFDVARAQNWVNEKNLEILAHEYKKIQEEYIKIGKTLSAPETIPSPRPLIRAKEQERRETESSLAKIRPREGKLSPRERKKRIFELLKNKNQITLSEIRHLFFQVSPRTLRRDMEDFIKKGIVARKRLGQKDVLYTLIKTDIKTDKEWPNL